MAYTFEELSGLKQKHYATGGTDQQAADWLGKEGIDIGTASRLWGESNPQTFLNTAMAKGVSQDSLGKLPGATDLQPFKKEPPKPVPASFTPTLRSVDPATETVQGRLPGILAEDGPLMQQAKTDALKSMNSRGLINSSMAVGAAQDATTRSALPIASQDAATYGTAANANQSYANQAGQFNAGQANQMQMPAIAGQVESGLINQRAQADLGMQKLRGEQATQVAQIEAQYKTLMQTSDSVARFFAQTQASIADILKEPNIPASGKDQMIQKNIDLLKAYMSVASGVSNLNLSALLTFSTPAAA